MQAGGVERVLDGVAEREPSTADDAPRMHSQRRQPDATARYASQMRQRGATANCDSQMRQPPEAPGRRAFGVAIRCDGSQCWHSGGL